ncbi:hypothetical protein FQR65_LT03236 [Abscondita terminalis]|nr:hypothetical protein FQR65_LT03236 [Abscondita terminalis]
MTSTVDIIDEYDSLIADLENKVQNLYKKLSTLQQLDLLIDVISYKIFETQHHYKMEKDEYSSTKETLLANVESNDDNDQQIAELEKKIVDLTNANQESLSILEHQKHEVQKEYAMKASLMDSDFEELKTQHNTVLSQLETLVLSSDTRDAGTKLEKLQNMYENYIIPFDRLQTNHWKDLDSQEMIAASLEDRGLRVTPSNRFLTSSGKILTVAEVKDLGLLDELSLGSWADVLSSLKKSGPSEQSSQTSSSC